MLCRSYHPNGQTSIHHTTLYWYRLNDDLLLTSPLAWSPHLLLFETSEWTIIMAWSLIHNDIAWQISTVKKNEHLTKPTQTSGILNATSLGRHLHLLLVKKQQRCPILLPAQQCYAYKPPYANHRPNLAIIIQNWTTSTPTLPAPTTWHAYAKLRHPFMVNII